MMNTSKPRGLSIESLLSGVMKPVAPRQGFVRTLGHKIQGANSPAIVTRMTGIEYFLLILAGVISLGALVAYLAHTMEKRRPIAQD